MPRPSPGLAALILLAGCFTTPDTSTARVDVSTDEDTPVTIELSVPVGATSELVAPPTHGHLSAPSAGRTTYTPDADWSGTDTFSWLTRDVAGVAGPAQVVTITVVAVNDAPTAEPATVDVDPAGGPVEIALGGQDPEGEPLTCTIVEPSRGTVSLDGCVATYTPTEAGVEGGTDRFTFSVSDGLATSAPAAVQIHLPSVDDPNQPPVGAEQDVETPEDVPLVLTLVGTDPDGDLVTFAVPTPPLHGDVVVDGDRVHYVPRADETGPDRFDYIVTDSHGATSAPYAVRIAIQDVEDAPTALDETANTLEDHTSTFVLTATDPDRDETPRFTVVTPPAHGTATVDGDTVTWIPAPDYSGTDSLRFSATDPAGYTSAVATVTLSVRAVNDPPVPSAVTTGTDQDTPVVVPLAATDVDGDALSFGADTGPAHGSLVYAGASVTYTPEAGWSGTDTFTYASSDGALTATAPVTVEVLPIYAGITVEPATGTTDEDTPLGMPITATSTDGVTILGYRVVTTPAHGTATVTGTTPSDTTVTYTPAADYAGDDTFTIAALGDDGGTSAAAPYTVTVLPVDDAPRVTDLALTTAEDAPLPFYVDATDPEGDTFTVTTRSLPAHGTLDRLGTAFTYTPDPDWSGEDGFTWDASDGTATSALATVTFTVTAVDDAPTLADQAVTTPEDVPVDVDVRGGDAEDGTVTDAVVVAAPSHGTVDLADGVAHYVPDADWSGADQLSVAAVDSEGVVGPPALLTVTVTAVNDAPRPTVTSATTASNTAVNITLDATDPEGDSVRYDLVRQPPNGRATLTSRTVRYTPDPDFYGEDSFDYTATDGAATVTATVTVTVENTVLGPEITVVSVTTSEDTPVTFTLTATSPHGDDLSYTLLSPGPTFGTVRIDGSEATYAPEANQSGTDSFRWKVTDTRGYSATSTATVIVTAVNDAPVANSTSASTPEDTPVTVHLTATDPDRSAALTYTVVTPPTHGTLGGSGPSQTWRPAADYNGTDSFTWTASDGTSTSNVATVTLTATAVDDPPTAWPSSLQTAADTSVSLAARITDPDSSAFGLVLDDGPSHGSVTATADGWTYTPDGGYHGRDRFTWHANDGTSDSDPSTTVIVVHPPTLFDRPPKPQLGVNKIAYADDDSSGQPTSVDTVTANLAALGAQMQRQVGNYDLVWSQIARTGDRWDDPTLNTVLADPDVEPSATLFSIQYASPTSPFCTDSANFEKTMGDDAYAYLDHVLEGYQGWLTSYEIGNEMYHWGAATSGSTGTGAQALPDCYPSEGYTPSEQGQFIHDAAVYLQAGDPDAIISLAAVNTTCGECADWLADVTSVAADQDWFDVVTYHAYDPWTRTYSSRDDFEAVLQDIGAQDKLVRLTEMGSSWDPDYIDRTNYPNSDASQCADVFRLSLIAWSYATSTVIWHDYAPLTDPAEGVSDDAEFIGYELFDYDGTPRPSAYAYALLSGELLPLSQITAFVGDGVYAYEIVRDDGAVRWVVWGTGDWTPPAGTTEWTSVAPDADNTYAWTPLSAGEALPLTATPLLVR